MRPMRPGTLHRNTSNPPISCSTLVCLGSEWSRRTEGKSELDRSQHIPLKPTDSWPTRVFVRTYRQRVINTDL